ncbi:MAG: hypothetical protein KAF91_31745 [Nostoc sp. TH1S01]|nr:hypothetical protein [Nostoc sp. TH1S01]
MTGNTANNELNGDAGNDTLIGGAGNDILKGDSGYSLGPVTNAIGDYRDNTKYLSADVNKDGAVDLIEVFQNGNKFASATWINNGQGTFNFGSVTNAIGDYRDNTQYLSADVNKDGAVDLIEVFQNGNKFASATWINNGQGTFNFGSVTNAIGDYRDNTKYLSADVNKDGAVDLIEVFQNGDKFASATWINGGNDILTGGTGKDTLTGGLATDRFDYRNLTDSLLNNFDVITDFNANAGNDLFLVSIGRSAFSDAGSVATLDTTGIASKLTATDFGANSAAQFSFGTRTFVAINDATAGFNAQTDAIIEVTGFIGTLGISNFTTVV